MLATYILKLCCSAFKISTSDIYYDTFPQNFEFGVATASYQVEGGKELRGLNIWDTFTSRPGNVEGKFGFLFNTKTP